MEKKQTGQQLASEVIGDLIKEIRNELESLEVMAKDVHAVLSVIQCEKLRIKHFLEQVEGHE